MIEKKVAIVTGGTRGIGEGIAHKLAQDGFAVCSLYVSSNTDVDEKINDLRQFSNHIMVEKCDISKKEDREKVINLILEKWGRIDVLVNNAGVAPKERMDMLELPEENFDFVMDVNMKGTFFFSQVVAKEMINLVKENPELTPRIINISSVSSYATSIERAEYCISKSSISMMTKLFAHRLAEENILVYEIRPGIISTDMTGGVKEKYNKLINDGITPIKRWGTPEDIGEAVSVFCSEKLNFSTGDVLNIDGGFHLRRF